MIGTLAVTQKYGALRRIAQQSGTRGVVGACMLRAYRLMRGMLPCGTRVRYAGIVIGLDRKVTDRMFPRFLASLADIPDYEEALVAGLRRTLRSSDRVVVVGGGWGVTATVAAQHVGRWGSVRCFEGSAEGVRRVRKTCRLNDVSCQVRIEHAVVGEAHQVYGTMPTGAALAGRDLPDCDLLELDCEGAELAILRDLQIRPRTILVETHGVHGAASQEVARVLSKLGYHVRDCGYAEPRLREICMPRDIRVLQATRI
ncbi:FkbM family methyltransferase [Jiella sp. MQZ9-1]|uniref:FkbM family methyltransferase n=1 Tax=Jiella flava TaxID=2816857 RepID=A0A939FX26_9HYPH|nr:FkbM family methyltransferase [Jiella flava]MBO0662454.1 FkbM family methyltransferase [Jiella flava]MCD2471679.1 FkbM family methyltransferase [Jiella flava]